jgi:hypothetical protein
MVMVGALGMKKDAREKEWNVTQLLTTTFLTTR